MKNDIPRVVVAVGVLLIIFAAPHGGSQTTDASGTAAPSSACVTDWTKCKDNTELANKWDGNNHASVACKLAANKQAKYGDPKWTWSIFPTFYREENSVATGVFTMIDNDVQFQNGFGAWAHVKVTCKYDLRQNQVLNVAISAD